MLAVELARVLADWTRGRAAVAFAATLPSGDGRTRGLHREAGRAARRLERLRRVPVAPPFGWLIRAAVAHQAGKDADAVRHLERAEAAFAQAEMVLYAAAARRQRGRLVGGETMRTADAEMAARGVVRPDRFAAMYVPGIGRPDE
jgi:hypothetical protein